MDDNEVLAETLSRLSELDLGGKVVYDKEPVADGAQGTVYKGTLQQSGRRVAIKQFRIYVSRIQQFRKYIAKEIVITSKLKHPNIVAFVGFMVKDDFPMLITEWAVNGSMTEYLQKHRECYIGYIALGIAKGLRYLHDNEVIHCDLKSDNILMSDSGEPLIADFGLSRQLVYSQQLLATSSRNGSKGTLLWMAPELLGGRDDSDVNHTEASDIWSFGMVIYELTTRERPYYHLNIRNAAQAMLIIAFQKQLPRRPETSDETIIDLLHLTERCWLYNPTERITAEEAVGILDKYSVRSSQSTKQSPPSEMTSESVKSSKGDAEERLMHEVLSRYSHLRRSNDFDNVSTFPHADYTNIYVGTIRSTGVRATIRRRPIESGLKRDYKSKAVLLTIWSRLEHPNVLKLIGYIFEDGLPSLLTEWQEKGDLEQYLKKFPESDIAEIALGIARGLKYLHDLGVIHGDLKSGNVLISNFGTPLIGGFDISEMAYYTDMQLARTSDGGVLGTVRWMAPELFTEDASKVTKASDVWTFGMTIYELVTRDIPYGELRRETAVIRSIISKMLPAKPESLSEKDAILWKLCERCWSFEPQKRPTAEKALGYLDFAFG